MKKNIKSIIKSKKKSLSYKKTISIQPPIPTQFVFHQHNIGCCEVQEKEDKLDRFQKKIKYERLHHQVRNVETYMRKNKVSADIITLQEVQEKSNSKKSFTYHNKKYSIIYRKTGILHYLTLHPDKEVIEEYEHGCAVVYNNNKFILKKYMTDYIIPSKLGYLPRSSPWVILQDKNNGSLYAVLSLHGLIFDPPNEKVLVRIKYFYQNLRKSMEKVEREYPLINFMLGMDLNANLFQVKTNYFKNKTKEYLLDLKKNEPIYQSYLRNLREFLQKKKIINSMDLRIKTNYNWNEEKKMAFYERIDFILHSKELNNKKWKINTRKYSEYKPKNSSELNFLVNDFDHLNMSITFG